MRTVAAVYATWCLCAAVILTTLGIPACAHAFPSEGMTDDEHLLFEMFAPLEEKLTAEGITVEHAIKTDAWEGSSPIGVMTTPEKPDVCVFVVAVRGNPSLDWFTAHAEEHGSRVPLVFAMLAHEAAHCMQRHARTYDDATEEKQADVFAIFWIARYAPDHRASVLREFEWVRRHYPQPGARYDTVRCMEATRTVDVSGMTFRQVFDASQAVIDKCK